ncbi:FISUMP domain-containing protein [Fibrobacter sp.]|uniref:FISUMP domain-containing protein n=1 Tax=Fibrobacter sp. TaxID=35828 RepID=UPI0025B997DF|nr:FISUMP domain-containing protein [Fibrobacter sp.]
MNKLFYLLLFVLFMTVAVLVACGGSRRMPVEKIVGQITDDRDGRIYKTVQIGSQTWMAENLNYRDPDSYCYGDSVNSCDKYGRLYGWGSAKESCPSGWRLPTLSEWDSLFAVVGADSAGDVLKSSFGWFSGANGFDEFGFSVLPAGTLLSKSKSLSEFYDEGRRSFFWSYTEQYSDSAYAKAFLYNARNVGQVVFPKDSWISVRCIKGNALIVDKKKMIEAEPIIDSRDGNTYKTVKIGSQIWMAENLRLKTDGSSCSNKYDSTSCTKFGRIYSWADAMDESGIFSANGKGCTKGKNCIPTYPVRGLCPVGYHLPTQIEWNVLISTVGGKDIAGKVLKSVNGWREPMLNFDEYGFSVLPVGSSFWSSTEHGYDMSFSVLFRGDSDGADLRISDKEQGYIRCVNDGSGLDLNKADDSRQNVEKKVSDAMLDSHVLVDSRDGQIYKTKTIGKHTWMAENLNYEMEYSRCRNDYASNCLKYGRYYSWNSAKKACPVGWHLPSEVEWVDYIATLGENISDEKLGKEAFFWSSTKVVGNYMLALYWRTKSGISLINLENEDELNVRCVKDESRQESVDSSSSNSVQNIITDERDGQSYKIVKIGEQTWMAENLRYESEHSFCNENDPVSCSKYGRLYHRDVADRACPVGWHLPNESEWRTLFATVGGQTVAGKKLKSTHDWLYYKTGEFQYDNGNGTDDFGFTALPAGLYDFNDLIYVILPNGELAGPDSESREGHYTCFHAAIDGDSLVGEMCLNNSRDVAELNSWRVYYAMSIRCLKDDSGRKKVSMRKDKGKKFRSFVPPSKVVKGTFKDSRDGKKYKTVKIGKQTWMAENLNFETPNSYCYHNSLDSCSKYGRFYTWEDAMNACPVGFHLPSGSEWLDLLFAVNDSTFLAPKFKSVGKKLKSKKGWKHADSIRGNGTDDYGFSALPAGYYWKSPYAGSSIYKFVNNGFSAAFWMSTGELFYDISVLKVYHDNDIVHYSSSSGDNAHSVRCVKD